MRDLRPGHGSGEQPVPETVEKFIPEIGRWFQARAIPIHGAEGRISMLVEQLHDIDDRKKAELALEEKEKRYRSLMENSFQGVVVAKYNPVRIVFASPQVTEILGYTGEELMDMTSRRLAELIYPDDRKKFFDRFKQRLSGRYAVAQERVQDST